MAYHPSTPISHELSRAARLRNHRARAQPFVLADADVLRELFECQHAMLKKGDISGSLPEDLLNLLSQQGRSTLIIPRMVMNELMRYDTRAADGTHIEGSFDFYTNEKGQLDFCTSKQGMVNEGRPLFAEYLDTLREDGMLRCYRSLHEMRENGELKRAKGGIVIVDTDTPTKARPISSRGVSFIRTTLTNEQGDEETISHHRTRRHAGDYALSKLARHLYQNAASLHRHGGILVLSNDTECKRLISESCRTLYEDRRDAPVQVGLSHLMHTLEYSGQFPVATNQSMVETLVAKRYQAVIRHPHNSEPAVTAAARASYHSGSPHYLTECLNWLEATGITRKNLQR